MEVLPTANFQPDIVVSGLRIGEPVIAMTGIFVAIVCFYAWLRLGRIGQQGDVLKLSRIFFLLTGLSTLIGGFVGHAFLYALPFAYKLPGWMFGMIAVSALEQAAMVKNKYNLGAKTAKILSWINIGELTIALWMVSATLWFPTVEIHSAFGFLCIVAPLEWRAWKISGSKSSLQILYGIGWLIAAVLAHIVKASLGIWFSYFDIAHIFMCLSMWQLMLGAEQYALENLSNRFKTSGESENVTLRVADEGDF